jgi:hypothetical protein
MAKGRGQWSVVSGQLMSYQVARDLLAGEAVAGRKSWMRCIRWYDVGRPVGYSSVVSKFHRYRDVVGGLISAPFGF